MGRFRPGSGWGNMRAPKRILIPGGWSGRKSSMSVSKRSPAYRRTQWKRWGGRSPHPPPFPVGFAVGGGRLDPEVDDFRPGQPPGLRISFGALTKSDLSGRGLAYHARRPPCTTSHGEGPADPWFAPSSTKGKKQKQKNSLKASFWFVLGSPIPRGVPGEGPDGVVP